MWDFVKNLGSWVGDFAGLDGSFGTQADWGADAGTFGLGKLGESFSNAFSLSNSGVAKDAVKLNDNTSSNAGLFGAIAPAAITGGLSLYGSKLSADAQKDATAFNRERMEKDDEIAEELQAQKDRKYAQAGLNFNNSF